MDRHEIIDEKYQCVLCGSTNYEVELDDLTDNSGCTDKHFKIVRCLLCEHRSIFPYPLSEDIERFYPEQYYAHVNHKNTPKKRLKAYLKKQGHVRFFVNSSTNDESGIKPGLWARLLAEPAFIADGKLLDVGCGNGEYLLFAQSCGWDVKGVEPDRLAVNSMRAAGLDVACGTAEQIPFPAAEFDVVRAWHSIEHTHSPLNALSEISRVLKPNGHLLISVPNYGCYQSRTSGKYWPALEVPRHLHHFTEQSLNAALEKVGLRKECGYIYSGIPFFDIGWKIQVMRSQGVQPLETAMRVVNTTVHEATGRLTRKDCRSFLTWWVGKKQT